MNPHSPRNLPPSASPSTGEAASKSIKEEISRPEHTALNPTECNFNNIECAHSAILNSIPDPAWLKNSEGIFLAVNRAWLLLIGKDEASVIGRPDSEIFDPATAAKLREQDLAVLKSRQPLRIEKYFPDIRGQIFDTLLTPLCNKQGEPIEIIGIARDITERRRMEEQFLRKQRMESIGSLASGIAHDLNNILGPIMTSASMLREEVSKEAFEELITIIQEASQRGADIVSQLLTFARGAKGERKPMEPRFLIRQIERILREILPKSITFTSTLPDGLWNITGDLTQLHQVFVNLCVNARDAMPGGGTLRLSAKNCDISPAAAALLTAPKPGRYVRMTVADSGMGIPEDIQGKIFDPFFTTKELGAGTGLGLSTALGIVKNHGGFIIIESKVGKGSKFDIYFPATSDALLPAKPTQKQIHPSGDGECILIVDDEIPICKMAETILKSRGYKVFTATSASEALEIYRQQNGRIRTVLTDLIMPGMSGQALTQAIKEINPATAVIASTGQSAESHRKTRFQHSADFFLPKPYSVEQLLSTVHQAVCRAAGSKE